MEFRERKLPRSAAMKMRITPIHTVEAYALMPCPVYLFMKKNNKFVSVKGPLDFFEPKELDKLRPMESFFLTTFADNCIPFRNAAVSAKAIMTWHPKISDTSETAFPEVAIPPTPYEISDGVFRAVAPLWGRHTYLDSFFVCIFINELLEPLAGFQMKRFRDKSVEAFERALVCSSWICFIAMHIGYCNLKFLNQLRQQSFKDFFKVAQDEDKFGEMPLRDEIDELKKELWIQLCSANFGRLNGAHFKASTARVMLKMGGKFNRIYKEVVPRAPASYSVKGENGFV